MTDIPGSYVPPSRGILWPRLVLKYYAFKCFFLLISCSLIGEVKSDIAMQENGYCSEVDMSY